MTMSDGFGAAFFGLTLLTVTVAIAALLVMTTVLAVRRGDGQVAPPIRYVAVGLVAAVVVVVGFGVAVLADEAMSLAVLFATVVLLPLLLVAGRAQWAGASWVSSVAVAGMAWCVPFLVGVGLLFAIQVATDVSTAVMTGLAGVVANGGALLVGERIGRIPDAADSSRGRR